MNLLIASIAGFLSGTLGAMGLGGGGILIIYLTLFCNTNQVTAQGINLIFFIPGAIVATLIYWKKNLVEWRIAIPISILGIIGSFLGFYMSSYIDPSILKKLFGILLLSMSVRQFQKK